MADPFMEFFSSKFKELNNEKIKCDVCGKMVEAGNNEVTGIPNIVGLGYGEHGEKIFNVCSDCVMNRYEDVVKKAIKFRGE